MSHVSAPRLCGGGSPVNLSLSSFDPKHVYDYGLSRGSLMVSLSLLSVGVGRLGVGTPLVDKGFTLDGRFMDVGLLGSTGKDRA